MAFKSSLAGPADPAPRMLYKMEQTIAPGTSSATAKEVLKRISEFERSYQMALNEAYADLQDTTFKDLRRALPVTKQKLDWNRITSYKLKGELQK